MTIKEKTTTRKPTSRAKKVLEEVVELPANPFAFEVLNLASSQKTNAKKVEILTMSSYRDWETDRKSVV